MQHDKKYLFYIYNFIIIHIFTTVFEYNELLFKIFIIHV